MISELKCCFWVVAQTRTNGQAAHTSGPLKQCLLRENPQRQGPQQVPRSPFALPHCWVAHGILARLDIRMWERESEEWDEGDFKLHD